MGQEIAVPSMMPLEALVVQHYMDDLDAYLTEKTTVLNRERGTN